MQSFQMEHKFEDTEEGGDQRWMTRSVRAMQSSHMERKAGKIKNNKIFANACRLKKVIENINHK